MAVLARFGVALQRSINVIVEDLSRVFGIPMTSNPEVLTSGTSDNQQTRTDPLQWDGMAFYGGLGGCPKHKRGIEKRRVKKRDIRRWYPYIRSQHMFEPCDSCGELTKRLHMCGTCYDQTRYETQIVREKMKEAGLELDQETVFKYANDDKQFISQTKKRVFKVDRARPTGWFSESTWGK